MVCYQFPFFNKIDHQICFWFLTNFKILGKGQKNLGSLAPSWEPASCSSSRFRLYSIQHIGMDLCGVSNRRQRLLVPTVQFYSFINNQLSLYFTKITFRAQSQACIFICMYIIITINLKENIHYIYIYIYMLAPHPKAHILTPWQMFTCQSIVFHVDVEELQEFRRYFDSLADVHVSEHCFPC